MRRRSMSRILMIGVTTAPSVSAAGQCFYEATLIPSPSGNAQARDINEQGHVAGTYELGFSGVHEAFIWTDGVLTTLERPALIENIMGGVFIADVGGLNDQGLITGTCNVDIPNGIRAFVHDGNGFTILPVLQDLSHTYGEAINDDLVVAGWSNHLDTLLAVAVIWQKGKIIPIEGIPGPESQAVDINNSGVVLGWTGDWYFYDADVLIADENGVTIIGKPPGSYSARPVAINDLGDITGYAYYPIEEDPGFLRRGFLWSDGEWTELVTFPPDMDESFPRDINNSKQIIGNLAGPAAGEWFIWQNGNYHFVDDLIVNLAYIGSLWSINDLGQIAGRGGAGGGEAVILTPVQGPIGDLTLDCIVGPADLAELLAQWGQCPPKRDCTADIAPSGGGDGVVGPADLAALLADWD